MSVEIHGSGKKTTVMSGGVTLTTTDRTDAIKKLIGDLSRVAVYVGIPEEEGPRKKGEITNVELMYIHSQGSPLHNIPPRPAIEPAIEAEDNKNRIARELGEAAKTMLDGKPALALTHLERAGMAGQNAARGWFTDPRNGWKRNLEETALRKLGKLKGKAKKEALARMEDGESPEEISRPLIDTGQLRKSITYAVKEG